MEQLIKVEPGLQSLNEEVILIYNSLEASKTSTSLSGEQSMTLF